MGGSKLDRDGLLVEIFVPAGVSIITKLGISKEHLSLQQKNTLPAGMNDSLPFYV